MIGKGRTGKEERIEKRKEGMGGIGKGRTREGEEEDKEREDGGRGVE